MKTQKISFFTRFNRPDTVPAPMGNGERSIFAEDIVDGKPCLKIVGKENFKDFIESSKSDTLISNIITRFQNGDVNALQRVQGFYGDITGMPNNMADAKKHLILLENQFNSLPDDIKKKFDKSFSKYVAEVSSYSVEDFSALFVPQASKVDVSTTIEKEVIVNE